MWPFKKRYADALHLRQITNDNQAKVDARAAAYRAQVNAEVEDAVRAATRCAEDGYSAYTHQTKRDVDDHDLEVALAKRGFTVRPSYFHRTITIVW